MALGSAHLIQKIFKWIWDFVEGEEHVRSIQQRDMQDKERMLLMETKHSLAQGRHQEITDAVFRQLAGDGGDQVTKQEVRKLGQLLGFHCDAEVWDEEFDEICTELQCQNTGF